MADAFQVQVTPNLAGEDSEKVYRMLPDGDVQKAVRDVGKAGVNPRANINLLYGKADWCNVAGLSSEDLEELISEKRLLAQVVFHGNQRVWLVGSHHILNRGEVDYLRKKYPGLLMESTEQLTGTDAELLRVRESHNTMTEKLEASEKSKVNLEHERNSLKAEKAKLLKENEEIRSKLAAFEADAKKRAASEPAKKTRSRAAKED